MSDEQREIIETIRDRRDRAVDAHGRTAAAMDAMHLSPFEQAVYVDAALNTIDALTTERDAARAKVERLRAECDQLRGWMAGYALLREQYAKEYLMRGERGKSDISTVVAYDIANALNAFPLPRAALETEADHE